MANLPIYAPFLLNIDGLNLAWATGTTITVAAGQCSNSTGVNQMILAAAVTIDGAVTGANGLDTGALGNSLFYAVHLIADSTGYNATAALLSLSVTAPTLPAGYDMFRRLGYVLTSGAGAILDFTQRGNGVNRDMFYGASIATDITAGASATFAAVDASASVPPLGKEAYVKVALTADAGATRTMALRDGGSSSAAGQTYLSSPASTVTTGMVMCPCGASGDMDYLVSNAAAAVALNIQGYLDVL
jgi:hypothetical protein